MRAIVSSASTSVVEKLQDEGKRSGESAARGVRQRKHAPAQRVVQSAALPAVPTSPAACERLQLVPRVCVLHVAAEGVVEHFAHFLAAHAVAW